MKPKLRDDSEKLDQDSMEKKKHKKLRKTGFSYVKQDDQQKEFLDDREILEVEESKQQTKDPRPIESRRDQLKLQLANILQPLRQSRSKVMIQKYPSSGREERVQFFSINGHKDNVLINPPIDYILQSTRGSIFDNDTPLLLTTKGAKYAISPNKIEANVQKVQFFEEEEGFGLNTRDEIIDAVKSSMSNWNLKEAQKYRKKQAKKMNAALLIQKSINKKYLKASSPEYYLTKSNIKEADINKEVQGKKVPIHSRRSKIDKESSTTRPTNLALNLNYYMGSQPTISPQSIDRDMNQDRPSSDYYNAQTQFVMKISKRLGSPPLSSDLSRDGFRDERPGTAQIVRRKSTLLSPTSQQTFTKYSQQKQKFEVIRRSLDHQMETGFNFFEARKTLRSSATSRNSGKRPKTPNKDEEELLLSEPRPPLLKRVYHKPFLSELGSQQDYVPSMKKSNSQSFVVRKKSQQMDKKLTDYNLGDKIKQSLQKKNNALIGRPLNPRLLQLKTLKHNMQLKQQKLEMQRLAALEAENKKFKKKGVNLLPFKQRNHCIRACTPEQIFQEHMERVSATHLLKKCVPKNKQLAKEIQKPMFQEIIQHQREIESTSRPTKEPQKQSNNVTLSKILAPDFTGIKQANESVKSSTKMQRIPSRQHFPKWEMSQTSYFPKRSIENLQLEVKATKLSLRKHTTVSHYYNDILKTSTKDKFFVSSQEIVSEGGSLLERREQESNQALKRTGQKDRSRATDFQKHLSQELGLTAKAKFEIKTRRKIVHSSSISKMKQN